MQGGRIKEGFHAANNRQYGADRKAKGMKYGQKVEHNIPGIKTDTGF